MTKYLRYLLIAIVAATTAGSAMARVINVRGVVTSRKDQEKLGGVAISDAKTGKLIGTTTDEGRYTVSIDDQGELKFTLMGHEPYTEKVAGRINIDVQLIAQAKVLDEIVVTAKKIVKTVAAEPTDLDVKGNYVYIKTRVKVPQELFNTSCRLVLQPALVNLSRGKTTLMRPVVFDGVRYDITQRRMYDYDADRDPLRPYVRVTQPGGDSDGWLAFSDSVYVSNPNQDYRCDLNLSIENYSNILYERTVEIGRGTVNPLRWLAYTLAPNFVTDESFLPQPEMQLRDAKGDINLSFPVGRSDLDLDLGTNRSEMEQVIAQLREIEKDPDSNIKSLTVTGTSSPEGSYATNQRLSAARLQSTMDYIMKQTGDATRSAARSTKATVHTWTDVADMLFADSLRNEAYDIMSIVSASPNQPDAQSRKVAALPYYRSLIVPEYLPRLRTVSYEYVTMLYRYLTDEEILEVYNTDPKRLTRNEFWRLYTATDSLEERGAICRKALELDPKFTVAATDLAAVLIKQSHPDADLLEPYIRSKKRIPNETMLNHAIALMSVGQYTRADSLAQVVPDDPDFHKAKIYISAINGNYAEHVQELSEDNPMNEVVLLLAMKSNEAAWEKAQLLGDTAVEEYLKAVAANRLDMILPAIQHIERALELDPSLRDIAKIDGDTLDLLTDDDSEQE